MTEFATFGAGCFWGVQATFDELPGVLDSAVGYAGGTTNNPTYQEVCTGLTGHAEVVQLKYDPKKITYKKLLETFWNLHDPTQGDRQGVDVGSQYRSIIFYHTPKQKQEAETSLKNEQKNHTKKITTQILKAQTFFRAEEYHQQYAKKHGNVC